jgi:2-dehydro-3-deoxygluconokinase
LPERKTEMMTAQYIAAFGEILLRLTPSDGGRLLNSRSLDMSFAGAESNVLSALAMLGHNVRFISKVPEGPLGESALFSLKQFGVDTSSVGRGAGRMGTYFIELGSSIRPSRVVYDRENSAISMISKNEFDWSELLTGVSWLHLTGITLALSENCLHQAITALKQARKLGVMVSFDLNYRRSLWDDKKRARLAFESVLEYTNLLFGNEGSLYDIFDWKSGADSESQRDQDLMLKCSDQFHTESVAFTRRYHPSASRNRLEGLLLSGNQIYRSKDYEVVVSDRFGTGDTFAAGVLHGISNSWEPQRTIDFSTAAFAFKHTIRGDQMLCLEDEIISIMDGNIHGHVIR